MNNIEKVNQFRDARNWRQFHNEKDLALSITLESSELLEIFQWKEAEEGVSEIDAIKDELADVLIYGHMLAANLDLAIDYLVDRKLRRNTEKYPAKPNASEVSADLPLEDKIVAYRAARNWALWDNAKDVAIAIAVEAAELLEVFQWREAEEVLADEEAMDELQDELADVIIYGYVLAQSLNLEVDDLITAKLEKNEYKYPVNKSHNSKAKYDELLSDD